MVFFNSFFVITLLFATSILIMSVILLSFFSNKIVPSQRSSVTSPSSNFSLKW